ncbi:hypothetical protein QFZ72_003153 [Bacillus sp. V2I10]|nr:hypothetical protein [Bacillus sp. V2I10]
MPCNGIFKFNQYGEKACLRKSEKAVFFGHYMLFGEGSVKYQGQ